MEIENMKIVDDPSVWEFSITEVTYIHFYFMFYREFAKDLQCLLIKYLKHLSFHMRLLRIGCKCNNHSK